MKTTSHQLQTRYKWYAEQAAKYAKQGRRGAAALIELKANYAKEFPEQEPKND